MTTAALPSSSFPKQAIVVIHGMGEQMPMDTIKGFVRAAWETDAAVTANGMPNPAEVWSKPDARTGSLELRRITTRQSVAGAAFPQGVRSDFYELYWADLSGGSTWDQVKDWVAMLLFRNPFTRVPRDVRSAWLLLWLLAAVAALLAIAAAVPFDVTLGAVKVPRWILALAAAGFGFVAHSYVVPYFGRVVRYTRAKPENIAARTAIRERGLALLEGLHQEDYERIIIVGHSLGSILAYDLVNYLWARRPEARTMRENTPEWEALCALDGAAAEVERSETGPSVSLLAAFQLAQRRLSAALRQRPKPNTGQPDTRWLVTDLVTLGSPLSHAEFLLAAGAEDLRRRIELREFPRTPPLREELDPKLVPRARAFNLPSRLFCFPFGTDQKWQLHHAAPYAVIRWTNLHDPALAVFCGDVISGPLAPVFGPGIKDIDLRALRGQSWRFTHTRYWTAANSATPSRTVEELRKALDLPGRTL